MLLKLVPMSDRLKLLYGSHETFHPGDSGFDLFFDGDMTIPARATVIIDLKVRCEALSNDGLSPKSFYLYPRSSISKTPLRLANSVGIIDAGYRGNLMAAVDNHSDEPYMILAGQRLFQICSPDLSPIYMEIANQLSQTSRGSGGFGSTG